MTHQAFIKKYTGKKIDFDGAFGGQCVDLFRQYVKDVLNLPQAKSVRSAAQFYEDYDRDPVLVKHYLRIPNTLTFVPKVGDIMIWKRSAGGGHGHIAVVHTANVWSFVSFDQNWRKLNVCELTKHNYLFPGVYGVLRPR